MSELTVVAVEGKMKELEVELKKAKEVDKLPIDNPGVVALETRLAKLQDTLNILLKQQPAQPTPGKPSHLFF